MNILASTASKEMITQNIFESLGADNLPEDEKVELLVKMGAIVQERVFNRIMESVSEEGERYLQEEVIDSEDANAFDVFLEKFVPNYQSIVDEEISSLRQKLIIKLA
jgi:hypothetical protein